MTHEAPASDPKEERPQKVAKTDDHDQSNAKSNAKSTASASAAASGTATATATSTSTATGSDAHDASAPSTATADVEANAEASAETNGSNDSHNNGQKSEPVDIDQGDTKHPNGDSESNGNNGPNTESIARAAADAVTASADCESTTTDAQARAAAGAAAGAASAMVTADNHTKDTKYVKQDNHDADSNGNTHEETADVPETDLRKVTLGAYVARDGLPFAIDPDTLTHSHVDALSPEKLESFRNAVSSRKAVCVLLAAGQGSRFKADIPKVIHPFMKKPLAQHALDAAHAMALPVIVVVGHARHDVVQTLSVADGASVVFVPQDERLGTGHAVYLAKTALPENFDGTMIVSYADNPGVDTSFLKQLLNAHARFASNYGDAYAAMAVTGSRKLAGEGAVNYGRIVRTGGPSAKENGSVVDIIEKKTIDALIEENSSLKYGDDEWTGHQLNDIDEFNSGIVVAHAIDYINVLADVIASLTKKDPVKYEYYATDFVKGFVRNNRVVEGFTPPSDEMWKLEGANTVEELKQLEQKIQGM